MKDGVLVAVAFLVGLGVVSFGASAGDHEPATNAGPASPSAHAALAQLPLYFVENRGVLPEAVRYSVVGTDKTLFFTDAGVTMVLRQASGGWAVKLDFPGANPGTRVEGRDRQGAVVGYFQGPAKKWKTGVPTFAGLVYPDLWPGIDLLYRGKTDRLKYAFRVAPRADPSRIRLRYRGVDAVTRTADGALDVRTPAGSFRDETPVAWQEIDGRRVAVTVAFTVGERGVVGFTIGDYDRRRSLVLDPAILIYCGFLGGSADDACWDVAVDAAGNAYVAGETNSSHVTFPVKAGPFVTHGGNYDAFVAKVNPAGTALVYCGYIGGSANDHARGVAIDPLGNAVITGYTSSNEASFPVRVGPDLTYNGGTTDAFVAKVNPAGTMLLYCGYIGGTADDHGWDVATDASANAYLVGDTASSQATFPAGVGPDLTFNGSVDAFVAKVNPAGTGLSYCGFLGGTQNDCGYDIAVDAIGQAHVTGETWSSQGQSFPTTVGPDRTYNGGMDGFIAKVNAAGSGLLYCGYIGGIGSDCGEAIALDAAGNAYVAGRTSSDQMSFSVLLGPDLTYNGGSTDAFVAKVNPTGAAFVYCGFIGGSGDDSGYGVSVDAQNRAIVGGETTSTEATFPVAGGPDLTHNGGSDAFLAVVNGTGTGLIDCGYVGGDGNDYCEGVALGPGGDAYLAGVARSSQPTFPARVGPDLTYNGGARDGFLAKVGLTLLQGSNPLPRRGTTLFFALTCARSAGRPYQLATAISPGPIMIGNRPLGLGLDRVMYLSTTNLAPTWFVNYAGVLGPIGQGAAHFNVPALAAIRSITIYSAFVTLGPNGSFGIQSISNTHIATIQ